MEKIKIEICPKCGGRIYKDTNELPRDALCFKCANCNWVYFVSNEKYEFVEFDPKKYEKMGS